MPKTFTPAERKKIIPKVLKGLSEGTPLTIVCAAPGMPCDDTVRRWADDDAELKRDIARARDAGWDQIALDAIAIADNTANDTKIDPESGKETANAEWITRSRLRVDTRLKLLAKWDPKRYGERQLIGSDPENPLPAGVSVTFKS